MYSNCGTGTVPKITRRNLLNRGENNISNNLEPVSMEQTTHTDVGIKPNDSGEPSNIVPSKDTTSAAAMSSNLQQNQVDKKFVKNEEDIFLDRRQVEDKLEQIREYISITTSLFCNMRKTDEQNDPSPDDSDRLEQMVHELKDSEHKLIRILENWNQSIPIPLPEIDKDVPSTSISEMVDYKDEAACLEIQNPLTAEHEGILQPQNELEFNKAGFPILNDNSRNNSSNQVEAIQELEDRLDTWTKNKAGFPILNDNSKNNSSLQVEAIQELEDHLDSWNKTQINRINLQEHLECQVEMLGDTISHMRNGSDSRRDIMELLDQKDCTLQAEHVSLQNKLLELQTKKQQVDQLVEQLHILNGHKSEDEDVGIQVRRIVSMKDQLSKLKGMLHSIQRIEESEKSLISENGTQITMENAPSESIDASLRIRNDVRNSSVSHLSGPLQEDSNVHRHTQKQVNKKAMNSIDRQRSLQAELQAKKHELEELMSKRKATSNLNHDGNSEKSSVGIYNSIYNAYNHKEQYSSDDVSDDDANDLNTDLNLSVESLTKNQMPQSQAQSHFIPERLSSISSSNCPQQHQASSSQQQDCWSIENRQQQQQQIPSEDDRVLSEVRKGLFMIDPNGCGSARRQQNGGVDASQRIQRIQMQKQIELIRNVCDSMLMEATLQPSQPTASTAHNEPQQQLRKNHTPSPLYSEPLSYNNTNCATPDNQVNQINVIHGDNPMMACVSPMVAESRGRMNGNSMIGGDNGPDGMQQAVQGSIGYNRKPISSANLDQATNVWQQQQQWLMNNTLQSQAFIMNTLNQCCQMMWLQQREIQSLRNAVQNMQLQGQNNSPISNNQQQRFNHFSNSQGGGSSTPYINASNSAFAFPIAGPSASSLQLPSTRSSFPSNSECSGVQKSNPNLLGLLSNPNQVHSFPSAFPNTMMDTVDVNHTDFIPSRATNSGQVRSNMTPMSDCLNNCSNNNLSNVNMNNVMHGGNNLASNSNPQIWHERSLNNQVNQGNSRANNYWDNFRR